MKKILSILETISLSTIISNNVIACKSITTNNVNNTHKKPIETKITPQQPPKNSNGKLIDDFGEEAKQSLNEKGYIGIYFTYGKTDDDKYGIIEKFNNIKNTKTKYLRRVYRGDGISEPTIPTINKYNGEIKNGNEKIES